VVERILYLLTVVAIGWAVTFGLRSLPFLLFAGRDRELPPWVERLGRVISPVIIGGLIVYSYSGLEWKTLWPYAAGLLTVGLQAWKRNPLVSIIAGTLLYMCLLSCGCTSQKALELDAENPAVRVSTQGVLFGDQLVQPTEVPEILEDYDIPHDRVIHILLDPDVKDLRPARFLMACLARAGYTRPVLVTKRHAEAENLGVRGKSSAVTAVAPKREKKRVIRYKKANE